MQNIQSSSKQKQLVLVTGGAGFIGSNLCKTLINKGFIVYAVDNLITGRKENINSLLEHDRFHFFELDITTNSFLGQLNGIPFRQIYHLACPTGVPNIKKLGEEMLRTSSVGTMNVLELARTHNTHVLFTSTAEIYGQPEIFPQHESYTGNVDPVGSRSAYEEGKRFAESLIMTYVRKYGTNARIVRVFNTYGPGMSLDDFRVIPQFLRAIKHGENLRVYGTGEQTRTYLYIDDLVKGLILAMEKGKSGEVYNIGSDKQISIKGLAQFVINLAGRKNGIVFEPHFIEDHRDRLPAIEKIKNLGWKPLVSLKEGLTLTFIANGLDRHEERIDKPEATLANID